MSRRGIHVPENCVSRAVLDLLAAERIWHRRFNTGTMHVEATETTRARWVNFGSPGMADILAAPIARVPVQWEPGRYDSVRVPALLWIETKSSTGHQRCKQKEFQAEVEAEGHFYLIAKSSDDVLDWLKHHGVKQ